MAVTVVDGELRVRLVPLVCTACGLLSLRLLYPYMIQLDRSRRKPTITGAFPMQALARSLELCQKRGMRRLPLRVMLKALGRMQDEEGASAAKGSPTPKAQDVAILDELLHWAHVAEAAYGKDGTEVSLVSGIAAGSISACELLPDILTHRPAYLLALDGSRQAIVVSIRGTADLLDIITDISAGPTQLDDNPCFWAHEGISRAAKQVFEEVRGEVRSLRQQFPAFRVVVVGHSMGGATAALLTLLLEREFRDAKVHGYAYAPAACVSQSLLEATASCVTAVACSHDVVSCLSVHSIDRLNQSLEAEIASEDRQKHKGKKMASVPLEPLVSPEADTPSCETDFYPPGQLLLLDWNDGGSPPKRRRLPTLFPGAFFTRLMGIDWSCDGGPGGDEADAEPSRVHWDMRATQAADFERIVLSPWSLSDHMLSTIIEGLDTLLLRALSAQMPSSSSL